MSKTILFLATLTLIGSFLFINQGFGIEENNKNFQNFKVKFHKNYGSIEEAYRLAVYVQNVLYAQEYNQKKGRNVFGETIFFDLTDQEFAEIYLNHEADEEYSTDRITLPLNQKLKSLDWVAQGAVTGVKNQGQCGSGWAFGTTGVLEGHFYITTGELPNLSEQQLMDCSTWADLNYGCDGGMPQRALNYVKRNGITTQQAYPYTAIQGTCAIKGGVYKANGHIAIDPTEEALIAAIQYEPVSVRVDATNWKYYDPATQSIFSDCGSELNQAVLAVGYNDESIKIKNSWGSSWGDAGYIYLKRGANTCGVWNTNVIIDP